MSRVALVTSRLHHELWREHDDRIKALLLIQYETCKTRDPLAYCWLVRIGHRLAQSLWKENCNSAIGLIQNFRDEGAAHLARILCELPELPD